MGTEFWIMTGIHVVIFFVSRHFMLKSKRRLEREKAVLETENKQLTGKVNHFKKLMKGN
jgi:hypothetical protein